MKAPRVTILAVLVLLAAEPVPAGEAFYSVPLVGIDFTEGALPPLPIRWSVNWRRRQAMRPYARIDGEGEAFVQIDWRRWSLLRNWDNARLAIRTPQPRKVTGRLYVPATDGSGMQALEFTLREDRASGDSREAFFKAKEAAYRELLARDIPGAAWFRHQVSEVGKELGKKSPEPGTRNLPRRPQAAAFDDTFDLFSGGKALSENLQLDRLLPPEGKDREPVQLDSIQGISTAAIDWAPLVKGLDPRLDVLASNIPADQHAVFFPSFQAMVDVLDEADVRGTPVLEYFEPRSEDARTKARLEKQLCLEVNALSRMFGPGVIASVAMTGSDPYLRTGSDVAVLFEAKEPAVLKGYLAAKHAAARKAFPAAKVVRGEHGGVSYSGVVAADRSVSSYMASLEKVTVVSNSLVQIERIIDATGGAVPALAGLPEYVFFRDRYGIGKDGESAFLMLSDAAIRRWCGPRWRIGSSRRARAAAVLSELEATNLRALASGDVEEGPLYTTYPVPGGGSLHLTAGGVVSSVYGSLDFLTPIVELDLETVTRAEAEAYRRWRNGYQNNWRRYFDPIAVRLSVSHKQLAADLSVMPLIAGTDYKEYVLATQGIELTPESGDPHPESLLHFVMAINPDSEPVREVGNFARILTPQLKVSPLSWLGSSLSLYFDADPFWDDLAAAVDPEVFLEKNIFRLPVALRVEISNSLTATAFLAGARAFIQQTSPGTTKWESLEFEGHPYVRVTPTDRMSLDDELENLAVYYAVTPTSLTITLSRSVLERALKREGPGRASWLGKSLALQVKEGAGRMIDDLGSKEYVAYIQALSWGNLPVLNEWKRLFPSEDPVKVHERVWGVKLVCPAGGRYVWNAKWETMESTAFGHPGAPQEPAERLSPLRELRAGNFGVTFEGQGLRARAVLDRKEPKG